MVWVPPKPSAVRLPSFVWLVSRFVSIQARSIRSMLPLAAPLAFGAFTGVSSVLLAIHRLPRGSKAMAWGSENG